MPVALVLAGGFLVLFVSGGARFSIGLALKPMVDDLGWLRADLGLAVGLYMVVSAFATFIAGRLADSLGGRAILGVGTVIGGVGIGLMCLVSAPWHAMLLYGVVFAVGNGAASLTTVSVMVTRAVPQRAGLANAFTISGQSFGQLVMIAMLAAVLAQIGWRSVFVWLAVAHVVLIPIMFATLPRGTQAHATQAPPAGASLREAARTRRFWLLLAVYAICGLDDFFVGTHVAAFAQDRGATALMAGNLLALMGLTALIGVLAGGWLSDRSGPVLATAIAFAARIVVFGLILRRDLPRHRASHGAFRARRLRHAQPGRAHRPHHDGAPDLRRHRRLRRGADLRRHRQLRRGVPRAARPLGGRAGADYFFGPTRIRSIQILSPTRSSPRNLRVASSVILPCASSLDCALPMKTSGRGSTWPQSWVRMRRRSY